MLPRTLVTVPNRSLQLIFQLSKTSPVNGQCLPLTEEIRLCPNFVYFNVQNSSSNFSLKY